MLDIYNCTGCRASEQICFTNCIRMIFNEEGFLIPEIFLLT